MEIRVLQYFLEVAEQENITKAAEVLHITQPALSRQLANLEDELGKKLLVRGKQKTTLTEEGRLLQKRAQEINSLVHKTKEEIQSDNDQISGPICIGCAETRGMNLLLQLQKEILLSHPNVCLHLYDGHELDVTEKLDKGILDFGVLTAPAHLNRYEYIRLPHKDRWGVLMRKDAPLAAKKIITPGDLWHLPLILSRQAMESGDIAHILHRDLSELHITGTYNLILNTALMVETGIGYAVSYEQLIPLGEDSPLTFRPLSPAPASNTYFIWKRHQLFSPAARLLMEKLKEAVETQE